MIIGPAVKAAAKYSSIAARERHQGRATVSAGIDEAPDRAVFPPDQEDRLSSHVGREVVAGTADLAFVREEHPTVLEQLRRFGFEDVGIEVDAARHPQAAAGVLDQGFDPCLVKHRFSTSIHCDATLANQLAEALGLGAQQL